MTRKHKYGDALHVKDEEETQISDESSYKIDALHTIHDVRVLPRRVVMLLGWVEL